MKLYSNSALSSTWDIPSKFLFLMFLLDLPEVSSVLFPWLFPRLRCIVGFAQLKFDLSKFDSYPRYFDSDSVMKLAQTGRFEGVDGITEYVKFADPINSPYVNGPGTSVATPEVTVLGLNRSSGMCEFLSMYEAVFDMPANRTRGVPVTRAVTMVKLFFDLSKRKIRSVNVYFPADFMRVFFGVALNSSNTRKFICEDVIKGSCINVLNNTNSTGNSTVDCENKLNALPATEGSDYDVEGYSQGCRALHAGLALNNPTKHCAHVSFVPMMDPLGHIKCQAQSRNASLLPLDLFAQSELDAFDKFTMKKGLDPTIGHNCTTC